MRKKVARRDDREARVNEEMEKLKQTKLQRLKNRGKKGLGLRIRRENEKIDKVKLKRNLRLSILT